MSTLANLDIDSMTVSEAASLLSSLRSKLGVDLGAKRKLDYTSLDWSKKNNELAEEHGVSYVTICKWRNKLGKEKVCGGKHYPACLSWDWSKSNTEIARENSVLVGVVAKWRTKLGKPTVEREQAIRYSFKIEKPDFSNVDWSLYDAAIAKQVGCTREYVRQMRAKLGKPKSLFYDVAYNAFLAEFSGKKSLTWSEAKIKIKDIGLATLRRYCARAGIELVVKRDTKHPWHLMDFRLPNSLLGSIWNLNPGMIANRRGNQLLQDALFFSVKGSFPEQFRDVVDQQTNASKEWFSNPKTLPAPSLPPPDTASAPSCAKPQPPTHSSCHTQCEIAQ